MTIVALLLEKEKQTYFAKVEPKVCWPEFCNEFLNIFGTHTLSMTTKSNHNSRTYLNFCNLLTTFPMVTPKNCTMV